MPDIDGQEDGVEKKKRKRRRTIIWFNPPYSANVKTNIGKRFFGILKKHFPEGSELEKLFNKKSVKLSYSCMANMKSSIAAHNKKMLKAKEDYLEKGCNCMGVLETCPMAGQCLKSLWSTRLRC